MDSLPRQALIDARVFEVDLTDSLDFGVTGALELLGSSSTDAATVAANASTGAAFNTGTGFLANTINIVGNSREILWRLNALRVKTKVKVLESPSVLALDGTQASITVGAQIPYPSGGFVSTAGQTTTVEYRTTGVTLYVVPRISASGSITLDVTQEISSPGAEYKISDTQSAVSFNQTQVQNTFTVKDGDTVAIAGLIRDRNESSRTGIPILSEIPLLGNLFGQTAKASRRSELIIMITPHVIKTVDEFQDMTYKLRDSMRLAGRYVTEVERERAKDIEDSIKDRTKEPSAKETKPGKPVKPKKSDKSKKSGNAAEPPAPEATQKP